MNKKAPLLVVDLDQTLIRNDLLVESVALLIRKKPLKCADLFLQLLGNKRARMKSWLADNVQLSPNTFLYRQEVIDFIKQRKQQGQMIALATASNIRYAQAVQEELGLFDFVLASDEKVNLKGAAKLAAIEEILPQTGADGFEYIGDCKADIPLFKKAKRAYLFAHSSRDLHAIKGQVPHIENIGYEPAKLASYIRLLRPHQWVKNILMLLPLLLSYQWMNLEMVLPVICGIALFSLTASSVYVLNDFGDVEKDREHSKKHKRPFASGDIPLWQAPIIFGMLFGCSVGGAFSILGTGFALVLLGYLLVNIFYSFWFKYKPVLDVIALTLLYVLRVEAGGVAAGVEVSDWLLTFSLFFFLSLAFGKRYQEVLERSNEQSAIRGYLPQDLNLIQTAGISSGAITVLVLALYIRSSAVTEFYPNPRLLWLLCPLILYWTLRFWIVTLRGKMNHDPVVFALKDRVSYLVGASMVVIVLASHLA